MRAPDTSTMSRAALFQVFSKFAYVLVQLGVNMLLARLIRPEEFGTVAVLTVFSGLFLILTDAGISSAIVQFHNLDWSDYRRLLTFSMMIGLLAAVLFWGVCVAVAVVSKNTVYYGLGGALSLSVLFNSLNMVPNGILLKRKRFDLVGTRLVLSAVCIGVLTVLMAIVGLGVYALALNSVLTAVFVASWNLVSLRLTPKLGEVRSSVGKVLSYSAFQLGHECAGYLARSTDNLIVGLLFGVRSVGYYGRAYSLSGYPQTYFISSITSTLRTFFADHQDEPEVLYGRAVQVAKVVSLVAALFTCTFFVCADEIVIIMFGAQWEESGPLLRLLSLAIYAQSMNGVLAPVMAARGKTSYLMLSTTINSAVTIVFIVAGAMLGSVISLAFAVMLAYNVEVVVPLYFAIRRCLNRSVVGYLRNFGPEILVMMTVVIVGALLPIDNLGLLGAFGMKLAFSMLAFMGLCALLGQGRHVVVAFRSFAK